MLEQRRENEDGPVWFFVDEFIRKMATEYRIQCVVQYSPLYRYPFYQKLGLGDASCSNTDKFFDSMVSFPFQQSLTSEDLDNILLASKQVLRELAHE
ncbi:MAG: DegT/DnrJ/EryC1/StrS family aminotransferase [bacterium]